MIAVDMAEEASKRRGVFGAFAEEIDCVIDQP